MKKRLQVLEEVCNEIIKQRAILHIQSLKDIEKLNRIEASFDGLEDHFKTAEGLEVLQTIMGLMDTIVSIFRENDEDEAFKQTP